MQSINFGSHFPLKKIVSGGQTGVDRAALDSAIFLELEHGGWCPRGRRAEDGRISEIYQLSETNEVDYAVRTERNVIESDGTLILGIGKLTGGTRLTEKLTRTHRKPCMIVDLDEPSTHKLAAELIEWISNQNIQVLNIAGPRESSNPGISRLAETFLIGALT